MVIVTGHKGLIGRYLMEELKHEEIEVKGLDLPECDITDLNQIFMSHNFNKEDSIIHCAAMSYIPDTVQSPALAFKVNIEGTFNLLQIAKMRKIKHFIYISSVSTYGNFGNWLVTEQFPLRPKGIYGTTKASADFLTQAYWTVFKVPTTVIRTSSVYGIGDKHPRIIKNFVENAVRGLPLVIRGNGQLRRDFTYVKDIARGIKLALNKKEAIGEIFNITGCRDYSLNDLVTIIRKYIPTVMVKYASGRQIDLNRGELDNTKAKHILGYYPEYTLEKGIKEMIDGYHKVPQNRQAI